jgi:hypothetical protein
VTQPIPATNLIESHHRSDPGACGFVLTGKPEITVWLPISLDNIYQSEVSFASIVNTPKDG